MGKPLSLDLRRRIVTCVEAGYSRRAAAARFDVSPSFVVELMRRYRETGSLEPARQGRPPGGRLTPLQGYLSETVEARPDITMRELAELVLAEHGVSADPSWISRCLIRLGFSYKKIPDRDGTRTRPSASGTPRLEPSAPASDARAAASAGVSPLSADCFAIACRAVDETSTTTKMTRLRGRAPCGERLLADAPFGHWGSQTFVAGLRCDALIAPWVIDGAMNRAIFETYIETQLAPCLAPGDVVILDNLAAHKSHKSQTLLKAQGNWLLFLPPYSPDLNPIEMAFSKLKAHLRRLKARTLDDLWRAVGNICDLFDPDECWNYFNAAGYAHD